MSDEQRQRERRLGCLVLTAFAAIMYLGNLLILFIPNAINKAKWERQGITHYEIVVDYGALFITSGRNRIVVQDRNVVEGYNESACPTYSAHLDCRPDDFRNLIVEEQFKIPSGCY